LLQTYEIPKKIGIPKKFILNSKKIEEKNWNSKKKFI